jgi:hypothetical protein
MGVNSQKSFQLEIINFVNQKAYPEKNFITNCHKQSSAKPLYDWFHCFLSILTPFFISFCNYAYLPNAVLKYLFFSVFEHLMVLRTVF